MEKEELVGKCFKCNTWNNNWAYYCITGIDGDTVNTICINNQNYKGEKTFGLETGSGVMWQQYLDNKYYTKISRLEFHKKYLEAMSCIEQTYKTFQSTNKRR